MSDDKIPGVDYAALGRVLRRAKADGYGLRKGSDDWVVPVIAAYREQMRAGGVVEVKREDIISIIAYDKKDIPKDVWTRLVEQAQPDKENANS